MQSYDHFGHLPGNHLLHPPSLEVFVWKVNLIREPVHASLNGVNKECLQLVYVLTWHLGWIVPSLTQIP